MLGERVDDRGRLEVRLVAERGEAGDPETHLSCKDRDLERKVAALEDEPDRARSELVRAEVELSRSIVDAETVRSEQNRARGSNSLDDGPLAPAALLPGFPQAGCDRDDCACAGLESCIDHLLE